MQTFLGLDLAWHGGSHPSALAVLRGDAEHVELVAVVGGLAADDEIVDAIAKFSTLATVLAIDAPLVVVNVSGQRLCETAIGQCFGHAHASAHSSNLSSFPSARSIRLLKRLLESGWNHDVNPAVDRGRVGRWLFEVYPHPAHVVLFDLPGIIKYKKGPLAQRRAGLKELQTAIVADLGRGRPRLVRSEVLSELTGHPLDSLRGKMLKRHEDELDALLCAYVAAHYWTWGPERNEMFGSMDDGYIVNPARTVQGRDWSFRKHPQAPAFDTSPVAPIAAQRGSLTTSGGAQ